jgi:hypothetical protein
MALQAQKVFCLSLRSPIEAGEILRNEPAFAAKVMALHGKRLGCWCKGTRRDFSKCHGHIVAKWAEMIFDQWEELKPDKAVMRQWLNQVAREVS